MGPANKCSVDSSNVGFLVSLTENPQLHHLGTTPINTSTHHSSGMAAAGIAVGVIDALMAGAARCRQRARRADVCPRVQNCTTVLSLVMRLDAS